MHGLTSWASSQKLRRAEKLIANETLQAWRIIVTSEVSDN
jgi:hypothetical protein